MTSAPAGALRVGAEGRLDAPHLLGDPRLRRVLDLLNEGGEETRVVGGAVRNALLGLPAGDIDLATTAPPDVVTARAALAGLRAIPTGLAHGTVTLMVRGHPFEVTTLREDIETDGRHAVVRFGRDFEADARRRDFTVNALSVGPDGRVHDSVGGLDDLAAGRIRFIGDARSRIREDYLRILRFFRFHATYGRGPLDPEGLAAAAAGRDGLGHLSRERVRAELLKLLAAARPSDAVDAMDGTGLLAPILGGPARPERFRRFVEASPPGTPDPLLRLAALAVGTAADVDRLRTALRLSNAEQTRLARAVAAGTDLGLGHRPPDARDLRAALFEHGRGAARDGLCLLRGEMGDADPEPWQGAAATLDAMAEPVLPWSGADLTARGLKGPAVGAALACLREAWKEAGFPDDAATLVPVFAAATAPFAVASPRPDLASRPSHDTP